MRPLVRSEQLKLRMPREIKEVIVQRAKELQITQTAYVERLIREDNGMHKSDDEDRRKRQKESVT